MLRSEDRPEPLSRVSTEPAAIVDPQLRAAPDMEPGAREAAESAQPRPQAPEPQAREPRPQEAPRKDEGDGKDEEKSQDSDEDDDEPEDDRSTFQKGKDYVRRHPIISLVAAIVVVAAIVGAVLWYLEARHWESTDDAFIDARSFSISAKVGGYLTDVPVTDNQHLPAGSLIARIDKRDYQVAIDQAQAQVEAGQASVRSAVAQIAAQQAQVQEAQAQVSQNQAAFEFSRDENQRAQDLVTKGAGTVQRAQQTSSELVQAQANIARVQAALNAAVRQVSVNEAQQKSAEANLAQAQAQLEQAKLNMSYTDIVADQPGRVARLTAAKGQLTQAGTALTMFVPDELWVTANFKETQLNDMRPGQKVDMTIDAYPGRKLTGHVDSIQSGSGTVFSLLPAQNATGNYVKVVQRIPVKLVFDDLPDDVAIGPGMSVVPKIRVR